MPDVEIYSKTTCPYCIRAKRLLDAKAPGYREYVVDMGGPDKAAMVQRSGGRTTVPQIFIGGSHIGGCDDLMALDHTGKLDQLLAV